MTYCPVDMDIRNHAHAQGKMADKEMMIEDRAKDILEDFFDSSDSPIDERFITYFEEEGLAWQVVEIMSLKLKGREEDAQDKLDSLINEMRSVAGEMADEAAAEE